MKRPLVDTFYYLTNKFLNVELSPRKKLCMVYLRWRVTAKKEDRLEFVALAKAWRKVERSRVGKARSTLERKARKLFKRTRKILNYGKHAKQVGELGIRLWKEQKGVHHPDYREKRIELCRANRKAQGSTVILVEWVVTPPEGEPFRVTNLRKFCRESGFGLDHSHLCRTGIYPGRLHKGWKAEKYLPDF